MNFRIPIPTANFTRIFIRRIRASALYVSDVLCVYFVLLETVLIFDLGYKCREKIGLRCKFNEKRRFFWVAFLGKRSGNLESSAEKRVGISAYFDFLQELF